jgi:FG-GAP-like repeat/Matrixin
MRDPMSRFFRPCLSLESLDARLVPALTVRIDYSLDSLGFFNDSARRAALESAATQLVSRLDADFDAIAPHLGNSWSLLLNSPSSGRQVEIANPTIAANTIVIYAGGYNLGGAEAGEGGFGGYRAGGDSNWLNTIQTRGTTGFSLWGGSLAFDIDQNWNFTSNAPAVGQTDFFTVATHELGHLLGFGTADQYYRLVSNGYFLGANATAENGGTPPRVSVDRAHWAQGTDSDGHEASLQPMIVNGQRYGFSDLDYAVLKDIGWTVTSTATGPVPGTAPIVSQPPIGSSPTTPPVVPPTVPTVPTAPTIPPTIPAGQSAVTSDQLAVSKPDGSVQLYRQNSSGQSVPVGAAYYPFGGFGGSVRSATADLNGDKTPDLVFVAGAGAGSQIRAIDGKTGADIGGIFSAFEAGYTGGLFVATADLDRDGKMDVIVSPDRGGGGRVTAFSFANGTPRVIANFFGIEDANFRGGARVAAADVNGDDRPEIVVGAGYGGGPRVAIFDGATLTGTPRKLVNDFYAFDGVDVAGLRNGVYVAAGDLNGDGRAELVIGGGPGGGPRVLALHGADLVNGVKTPIADFFTFGEAERGGVRPAIKDVDKDGELDLVVASGERVPAALRIYTSATSTWTGGSPGVGTYSEPFGFTPLADGIYIG